MVEQKMADIVTPELSDGAIINDEFHGFADDYLVLHCLLRLYKPKSFFEIGTNMGRGTKIIKNALGPESDVYSLDLPIEKAHVSLTSGGDKVGHLCDLPFTQLRGDSMEFNFSAYPCDGYFVDGEHDYSHPYRETTSIVKNKPNIIIWHDSDIDVVHKAITAAMKGKMYDTFRVVGTRIAYAIRK